MAQNLHLRCVLISDPPTLGAGAKTRLYTPKAVTYHGAGAKPSIKMFTPHCIYMYVVFTGQPDIKETRRLYRSSSIEFTNLFLDPDRTFNEQADYAEAQQIRADTQCFRAPEGLSMGDAINIGKSMKYASKPPAPESPRSCDAETFTDLQADGGGAHATMVDGKEVRVYYIGI